MIPSDEVLPDKCSDEVGLLLEKVKAAPVGRAREEARRELVEAAVACGYILVSGHYQRHHVSTVGASCLYRVPDTKQGHLRRWRGRVVRIACWGSGSHSDRKVMVGPVDEDQIEVRIKGLFGRFDPV